MPTYRLAAVNASAHLKIVVSMLLSIVVALTIGLTLRAFLSVDCAIEKRIAVQRTH
jgi:hypothetical protein